MIITRTPLRISFFSGGSDLPSFYEKERGAALSCTIDKYIDVVIRKNPYTGYKTVYDEISEVNELSEMRHSITREALKKFYWDATLNDKGVTITSLSDIKCSGSGLGSSSAFTVGLVKALHMPNPYIGAFPPSYYAEEAVDIEMNRCRFPVGKQDQYAAAYGGFNLFEFDKDIVSVVKPSIPVYTIQELERRLLLVYSGKGRSANAILQQQSQAMLEKDKFELVRKSRDKAYVGRRLLEKGDLDAFGELLHLSWLDKKEVVKEITQTYFDEIYQFMLEKGATGGKLLGAGGGGFFIFYHPKGWDTNYPILELNERFPLCECYNFSFTHEGSKTLFRT